MRTEVNLAGFYVRKKNKKRCMSKKLSAVQFLKGGFPLSRKFYVRTDVHSAGFMYLNKIRSDVSVACVNVKS